MTPIGLEHRYCQPAAIEEEASASSNPLQNIRSSIAQMSSDETNQGRNPLLEETRDLLQAISVKPPKVYFEWQNRMEFYNPQLSLADLLHIGAFYYEAEFFESNAAWVQQAQGPVAFSAIGFGRYNDQIEPMYEELLRTHPQEQRTPFEQPHRPKYSTFSNFFKFQKTIQAELLRREENQDRIMQNIMRHVESLKDPGIERAYRATPDELFEKYGFTMQGAAKSDIVIIIHKKVPPAEQKGTEFYRQQRKEKYFAREKMERERGCGDTREPSSPESGSHPITFATAIPSVNEAMQDLPTSATSVTETQETSQEETQEAPQMASPPVEPQGFFLES